MSEKKKSIEGRLHRLRGQTADKTVAMHEASRSQVWWARCWSCHKQVSALRSELENMTCPHCRVNLWKRT